jgi:DNA-binding IclR family transcriptional regulator
LKQIQHHGYALDRGEHFDGIHCIAAPLLDAHGHCFAAITIAGPSSRIPEAKFETWGKAITEAASEAALQFLL